MDQKVVARGATVYLPVWHPGAHLYIGDVHAVQGDGELASIGLEIGAEVTVTLDLIKDNPIAWPWAVVGDKTMVMVSASTFEEARREAMSSMLAVLENQLRVDPADALALLSLVGDLRIGQACGGMDMTLRLEMPSSLGIRPA